MVPNKSKNIKQSIKKQLYWEGGKEAELDEKFKSPGWTWDVTLSHDREA